ncbi:MAG: Calx-beta domain-containing protein [Acidimicrobiales bacterium]
MFTASLSKASTSYVSVSYATAKGTAVGTDFTARSGTLTFAPGTTTLAVKVPVSPDAIAEPDEVFTVKLSDASATVTVSDAVGAGTIVDND